VDVEEGADAVAGAVAVVEAFLLRCVSSSSSHAWWG
jgi:hypothetical protein